MSITHKLEIFRGRRVKLYVEEHLLPNGNKALREVIRFPNSVVILPLITIDKIVLLYQYRPAIRKWIYELPAGIIEGNEDPAETASRELIEETGYKAGTLKQVFSMYLAPGYSTEYMYAFIAYDLKEVGAKPEPYEVIRREIIGVDEALEMIRNHEIIDAKTIALILYYAYNRNDIISTLRK